MNIVVVTVIQEVQIKMTASLQIKNEKYYVVLSWQDNRRKRHQKWINTDLLSTRNNKRKAEAKRVEILQEYENKNLEAVSNADLLFTDFLREWLDVIKPTVAGTTFYGYQRVVKNDICPYFEPLKIKLCNLKPYHIQDFYTYAMNEKGVSANTVHHFHANIHKALKYAVKMERITSNPSDKIELPPKKKHIPDYYTKAELQAFVKAIKNHPLQIVVMLAAWFGMRRGEIIGLKWSAIDFDSKLLSVTGTMKDRGSESGKISEMYYSPTAKNSTSIRTFPLSDSMISYLKNVKDKQMELQKSDVYNHEWKDFVCLFDNGDIISLDYVSHNFKPLCRECGLKPIKLHEMRHTNISILLSEGATLKELQEWAGHSTYSTTANIYSHLLTDTKSKLTAAIDGICNIE